MVYGIYTYRGFQEIRGDHMLTIILHVYILGSIVGHLFMETTI